MIQMSYDELPSKLAVKLLCKSVLKRLLSIWFLLKINNLAEHLIVLRYVRHTNQLVLIIAFCRSEFVCFWLVCIEYLVASWATTWFNFTCFLVSRDKTVFFFFVSWRVLDDVNQIFVEIIWSLYNCVGWLFLRIG